MNTITEFLIFISSLKQINEYHHLTLHTRISLDIKFQLKLTVLSFWTKSAQNKCFREKSRKVNISIELCLFKLA